MQFHAVAMTDRGLVRRNNEDNYYFNRRIRDLNEAEGVRKERLGLTDQDALFAVCDGMGGEALGEEASWIGVSGLEQVEQQLRDRSDLTFEERMSAHLQNANQLICDRMRRNSGIRMGTTFSALMMRAGWAQTVNLGDSRVYLVRGGSIFQLTRDHTHAQRLVDIGIISRAEAEHHPERHRLMQHLGLFPEERSLKPYLSPQFWLESDDRLLLCSDGVTDMITSDKLVELMGRYPNIDEAASELMRAALDAGGRDNITFILIAVDAVSPAPEDSGIRETAAILAAPPKWPLNAELGGDTRELPFVTGTGPQLHPEAVRPAAERILSPEGESGSTAAPDAETGAEPKPAEPETGGEPVKSAAQPAPAVSPAAADAAPAVSPKPESPPAEPQGDAPAACGAQPGGAVRLPARTGAPVKRQSSSASWEGETMKKIEGIRPLQSRGSAGSASGMRPGAPSGRPDIRRPGEADRGGLTPEDLERFRRAREEARQRQAGHTPQPDGGAAPRQRQIRKRPATAEDLARRTRRHNVGRDEVYVQPRAADRRKAALSGRPRAESAGTEAAGRYQVPSGRLSDRPGDRPGAADDGFEPYGGRAGRRRSGFWGHLLFFLVFILIGFAVGWLLLNIGKLM